MAKAPHKSITGKLIKLLLLSLALSLALFFGLFFSSNYILDEFFEYSSYREKVSSSLIDKFQSYATVMNLYSTDTEEIQDWAYNHNIVYLTVSGEDLLIDDHSFFEGINPSNRGDFELSYAFPYARRVDFYDKSASVFMYNNAEKKYYFIAYIIAALLSGFNGLLFLFCAIKDEVDYIEELGEEVEKMNSGLENASFRVMGDDEISCLAGAIENMRTSLIEKEQKELEMKKAQDNLVLGMAHDLRTPLTSLIAYIEIIKRQKTLENIESFSDKALKQAGEIKRLSDQMFDFFLINSEEKEEFETVTIEYAFSDYLSEMCNYLSAQGFTVTPLELGWPHQNTSICFDYIGRILNNLQSNIVKYADNSKPVYLSTKSDGKYFYISVENSVSDKAHDNSSNGIGLKNVNSMMKKMGGDCIIHSDKSTFKIELVITML